MTSIPEIIEAFDEKFVDTKTKNDWWKTDYDYPETATPSLVKSFLKEKLLAYGEQRDKEGFDRACALYQLPPYKPD